MLYIKIKLHSEKICNLVYFTHIIVFFKAIIKKKIEGEKSKLQLVFIQYEISKMLNIIFILSTLIEFRQTDL